MTTGPEPTVPAALTDLVKARTKQPVTEKTEPKPPKGRAYAGPGGGLCGPPPTVPVRPVYDPKRLARRRKT